MPNAVPDTTLALEGTRVTYSCVYGYKMSEESEHQSLWCDGQNWRGTAPFCEGNWSESGLFLFVLEWGGQMIICYLFLFNLPAIHCDEIKMPHAKVDSNQTVFGTVVRVTCNMGYNHVQPIVDNTYLIYADAFAMRCEGNATWVPAMHFCQG